MHVCTHVCLCLLLYVYSCLFVCMTVYTCVHVCMHACIFVCMYLYVCIYVCMYVHMYRAYVSYVPSYQGMKVYVCKCSFYCFIFSFCNSYYSGCFYCTLVFCSVTVFFLNMYVSFSHVVRRSINSTMKPQTHFSSSFIINILPDIENNKT